MRSSNGAKVLKCYVMLVYLAAYRLLRNKVSARLKRAKESYSRSLLEENRGDSESFWRSVKKILPDAK